MKMNGMGNDQLEELLTPTPKAGGLANVDNPLQIMDAMIEKYGLEGVHGNPQLQIHYHQLANKVAKMQKDKSMSFTQQMDILEKRRAAIMRQIVENHKNIRRVNKQLGGSDLLGTTKAELRRTLDMHTNETGKLTAMLDKIIHEREAVQAEINNNLGKGIGALSGIQDPVKDIQEMKKHGLLSADNPFFKKDNK